MTLHGDELVGVYILLSRYEDELDAPRAAALEKARAVLYEAFTIEELEALEASYDARAGGRHGA